MAQNSYMPSDINCSKEKAPWVELVLSRAQKKGMAKNSRERKEGSSRWAKRPQAAGKSMRGDRKQLSWAEVERLSSESTARLRRAIDVCGMVWDGMRQPMSPFKKNFRLTTEQLTTITGLCKGRTDPNGAGRTLLGLLV